MIGLIGAGISALGGIFGGRKRKKAAQAAERQVAVNAAANAGEADKNYSAAFNEAAYDQTRASDLRALDEARLKDATGIDMVKLVADAERAGFNPLTVLSSTGGAGYDGRGAVLTTPFVGRADAAFRYADGMANVRTGGSGMMADAGRAVAATAGYVGDAMSDFGHSLFQIGASNIQRKHEVAMQNASFRDAAAARSAIYGQSAGGGRNGGSAPLVGPTLATGPISLGGDPSKNQWVMNPDGSVYVPFSSGGGSNYDPRYLEQLGIKPNTPMNPGDVADSWNQIMGAVGSFDTWFGGTGFNQWLQRSEPSRRLANRRAVQGPPVAPAPVWRAPSGNPRGN